MLALHLFLENGENGLLDENDEYDESEDENPKRWCPVVGVPTTNCIIEDYAKEVSTTECINEDYARIDESNSTCTSVSIQIC